MFHEERYNISDFSEWFPKDNGNNRVHSYPKAILFFHYAYLQVSHCVINLPSHKSVQHVSVVFCLASVWKNT